jgi:hypothetical protein
VFEALSRLPADMRAHGLRFAAVTATRRVLRFVHALARRLLRMLWRPRAAVAAGLLSDEHAQTQTVQHVVSRAGCAAGPVSRGGHMCLCSFVSLIPVYRYPYEKQTATTPDGYMLSVDRIPRRGAAPAVLFVHGVVDCSFAWVGSSPQHALAYRSHDAGCDVWLLNLRHVWFSLLVSVFVCLCLVYPCACADRAAAAVCAGVRTCGRTYRSASSGTST